MLRSQHFYNTFTKNIMWQIVISGQKSTFNYKLKLKLLTTDYLQFIVKIL